MSKCKALSLSEHLPPWNFLAAGTRKLKHHRLIVLSSIQHTSPDLEDQYHVSVSFFALGYISLVGTKGMGAGLTSTIRLYDNDPKYLSM